MLWFKWIRGSLVCFEPCLIWVEYMAIAYCPKFGRTLIRAVVATLKALD
jgi:hypothetical protein